MMKLWCIGAFSLASFYYAQNYPVSEISDVLKKNASAVIRNESTVLEINKIDEIFYRNSSAITVINKDAVGFSIPKIYYEKGNTVSNIKVTIYDEKGAKVKATLKVISPMLQQIPKAHFILITG